MNCESRITEHVLPIAVLYTCSTVECPTQYTRHTTLDLTGTHCTYLYMQVGRYSFLSTSDSTPDGHEHAKRASCLQHGLPQLREQFTAPQAVAYSSECSKYCPRANTHCKTNHCAKLDSVEAAGTS